ncbi:hypothetical protein BD410DRAFT_800810 [Rickenella mellea]|uniref:BZIP domain-containing protein n=1 Tax=Rickenella mellea TaxID=50990 RepID=A0A4Y7QG65_9AGAM|nr:hypothetical protein BD410DRAFT_800810 [Rickenella mellea]
MATTAAPSGPQRTDNPNIDPKRYPTIALSPYPNSNHQLPQQASDASSKNPIASYMELRNEIPPAPPPRGTRGKRKSPPEGAADGSSQQPPTPQQQQQQQQMQQTMQPPPGMQQQPNLGPPPQLPYYAPGADYSTAGIPHMQHSPQQQQPGAMAGMQPMGPDDPNQTQAQRQLSTSKRAEQNRKAQRAFRERRDQHVKALESRSQLLDAALASADEANRRWEECRTLVDQLRIENAALRSALQQAQAQLTANAGGANSVNNNAMGEKGGEMKGHDQQQQQEQGRQQQGMDQNDGKD